MRPTDCPGLYFARAKVRHSDIATFRQNVGELARVPALWREAATIHFAPIDVEFSLPDSCRLSSRSRQTLFRGMLSCPFESGRGDAKSERACERSLRKPREPSIL